MENPVTAIFYPQAFTVRRTYTSTDGNFLKYQFCLEEMVLFLYFQLAKLNKATFSPG
jgi:hypothetical protein